MSEPTPESVTITPQRNGLPATLFCGAQVIDGTGADPFVADVLILGNKIETVGAGAAADAQRLGVTDIRDMNGKTLMPGLIDAHCHISFDEVSCNDELFFIVGSHWLR